MSVAGRGASGIKWTRLLIQLPLEGVIVFGVVLLCFFLLLKGLNNLFPEGSGLQEIMNREERSDISQQLQQELLVHSGDATIGLKSVETETAVLTEKQHDVRSRRANTLRWERATKEMSLYDQDAVQTFSNSSAVITFGSGNQIKLGENTLVIIKRMEQDFLFKEKRSYLLLVEGELRGSVTNQKDVKQHVAIITPNAKTHFHSKYNVNNTVEFKIKVDDNNASVITMLQGSAEVESGGKRHKINKDHTMTVRKNTPPLAPQALPKTVDLNEPKNGSIYYYRDIPDRIHFNWQKREVARYHLMISHDPEFKEIIVDEQIDDNAFTHGNLSSGKYYWRVSAIGIEGNEGHYSAMHEIQVVQDLTPPVLEVAFPGKTVETSLFTLLGTSEPGATIYIDGAAEKTEADGSFKYELKFKPGVNVVVVEAVDQAGNSTYLSKLISVGKLSETQFNDTVER